MLARKTTIVTGLRGARSVLVFVVALLALTHLATFAHFALVAHAQCPEHGDWMHVHSHGGAAEAPQHAAWHAAEDADGHDHCSAPTALRDGAAPRAAPQVSEPVRAAIGRSAASFAPVAVVAAAISLRTAPKTSPPA